MLAAASPDGEVVHLALPPMPAIVVAAFMALRYIGRGAGLQELMVLAGAGRPACSEYQCSLLSGWGAVSLERRGEEDAVHTHTEPPIVVRSDSPPLPVHCLAHRSLALSQELPLNRGLPSDGSTRKAAAGCEGSEARFRRLLYCCPTRQARRREWRFRPDLASGAERRRPLRRGQIHAAAGGPLGVPWLFGAAGEPGGGRPTGSPGSRVKTPATALLIPPTWGSPCSPGHRRRRRSPDRGCYRGRRHGYARAGRGWPDRAGRRPPDRRRPW